MARKDIGGHPGEGEWDFYKSILTRNKQEIENSWQRCAAAGMERGDRPKDSRITKERLRASYFKENRCLCGLAIAEMRTLYKYLGNLSFVLTFANIDGVILDRIPGKNMVASDADDLAPGNCWCEMSRGTNAVGTAAYSKQTTIVLGGDHFLRDYHDLICIAKPVYDDTGETAAILDATAQGRQGQMDFSELAYVLGLMHMSADHIETELFKERHSALMVIQVNAMLASPVGSTNAIFAFDSAGRLVNANRTAFGAFEAQGLQTGVPFEQIFRHDFTSLSRYIESSVDFKCLEDHQGCHYYATVYAPDRDDMRRDRARSSHSSVVDESANSAAEQDNETIGLMSRDPVVLKALATVERATTLNAPIMITGETGTGKEILARHIHRVSGRTGEFVGVNCAAIPDSLIEAELFGYEPGAFTGASRRGALGMVRTADGGTLFLDEIGDMPYSLQARLLRLLDSWQIRPVGSDREYGVDVQLVTATNRDLREAVERRQFRLDLLHRIKVVSVRLPALRQRNDFDDIVRGLLHQLAPDVGIDDDAVAELKSLKWPGNVRELRNTMVSLLVALESNTIDAAFVRRELFSGDEPGGIASLEREYGHIDDQAVEEAFNHCRGNVSATARLLGVSRTTVYKHLRRLEMVDDPRRR